MFSKKVICWAFSFVVLFGYSMTLLQGNFAEVPQAHAATLSPSLDFGNVLRDFFSRNSLCKNSANKSSCSLWNVLFPAFPHVSIYASPRTSRA